MNMNNFEYVSIVFEYDMMYAHFHHLKCFNFSNIRNFAFAFVLTSTTKFDECEF